MSMPLRPGTWHTSRDPGVAAYDTVVSLTANAVEKACPEARSA